MNNQYFINSCLVALVMFLSIHAQTQNLEVYGNVRLVGLDSFNMGNEVIVLGTDSTLALRNFSTFPDNTGGWQMIADSTSTSKIVFIGSSSPVDSAKMSLIGNEGTGIISKDTSASGVGIRGINEYFSSATDGSGVVGLSANYDWYGYGVVGRGGYTGTRGAVFPIGQASKDYYGVVGVVNGGTGVQDSSINIGVYGFADGADPRQNGGAFIGDWAVYASGESYSTVAWTVSDERLKKNILPVQGALEKIVQLQPKSYEFDENTPLNVPSGKYYGFLAQDLEKVIPEAVSSTMSPNASHTEVLKPKERVPYRFKIVNYDQLHAITVCAIQEQQEIIKRQNIEIENFEISA